MKFRLRRWLWWLCAGVVGLPLAAPAQLVINEVMANNGGSVPGPEEDNPDYIEIYNTSYNMVALSGWTLTDDINTPAKFAFPAGAIISGYGHVVVWLDGGVGNGYHANFALNNDGEQVALYRGTNRHDLVDFGPQALDKSLCRVPSGSTNWVLGNPTPFLPNVASPMGTAWGLRFNEWMATNSAGVDKDWLELYNPRTNGPVALGGLIISGQTANVTTPAIVPYSFIESGAFFRFWCSGDVSMGDNHLAIRLSSTRGETNSIYLPNRVTYVDRVMYGPQLRDMSMGRLPDGSTNIVTFPVKQDTPGESNFLPLTNVVFNEILAHTDPPTEDALELYNPTATNVNIGNWWLSNSQDEPQKYRFPANTIIPALGYLVIYEYQFNVGSNAFTFNSAHGDQINLASGNAAGYLTGWRLTKDFGSTDNNVSLGRYVKSDGGADFVRMSARTFGHDNPTSLADFRLGTGLPNAYPKVGPIVISEIMYHPPDIGTNDNPDDEYIELRNIASTNVPLYLYQYYTNAFYSPWRLRNAVDFDFPSDPANLVSLAPGAKLLVVYFDPETNAVQLDVFRNKYRVPPGVPILGPYDGNLANRWETIELGKPDPVQAPGRVDEGYVPYVLVEKVKYEDRAPWPANTDGTGNALHRLSYTGYANDQTNWFGAPPTPGEDFVPPVIIVQPAGRSAITGDNVSLSVTATGSAVRHQWRLNGFNLFQATNATLVLNDVQPSQSGDYTAVVYNELQAVTSAVATVLIVGTRVTILDQPQSQSVQAGSDVVFTVVATGSTPISYQWQFNHDNLPGQTDEWLVLTTVQFNQSGAYRVVLENFLGAVTSAVASLTVTGAPQMFTPRLLPDGRVELTIDSLPDRSYLIEYSTTLRNWTQLTTVTSLNSRLTISDTLATNDHHRFYRSRLLPLP